MKDNIALLLILLPFEVIAGAILLTSANLSPTACLLVMGLTIACGSLFALLLVLIGSVICGTK